MNKSPYLLPLLAGLILSSGSLHAQIFSSDYTGAAPWNFDTETDPQSQLAGTDQLTYGFAATNDKSWVEKAIDMSAMPETGTLVLSGVVNLDGLSFGTSDFDKRTFVELGASGNKSSFSGGMVFHIGVGGWNNPGEFSFGQVFAVRFGAGGIDQTGNLILSGDIAYEATITISGDDTLGWTIDATTVLTGDITVNSVPQASVSMNSSYTRTDAGFNGWKSVNNIRTGFAPDSSPTADSPEALAAGTFVMEGVQFATAVAGEPPTPVLVGIISGANFEITCPSESGYNYLLETSTDLSSWSPVETKSGDGSDLLFIADGPANPGDKLFYQVTVSVTP